MKNKKHIKDKCGVVPGEINVAFINKIDEVKAKQIIESAGYQLKKYNPLCHIAVVVVPPGKETQAIISLTKPGQSQAERARWSELD